MGLWGPIHLKRPLEGKRSQKAFYWDKVFEIQMLTLYVFFQLSPSAEEDDDSDDLGLLLRLPGMSLLLLSRRGGNLSRIFLGFKHHNCSGLIQFHKTHGNHNATPISMVRNTMSCVFRLVRLTLKCVFL
jgi:hypothetical protein